VLYDSNKKEIILMYESETEISVSEFRLKLSTNLSKYMIPTKYIRIGKLPKNISGKIDRNALKKSIL
jgi:D-alanine--poly(phosphoribitol) ligase subunit 1